MAIIKCEKGHFYDNVKYSECPHCKAEANEASGAADDSKTIAKIASDKMKKKSYLSCDWRR